MTLYCDTNEFAAICSGNGKMKQVDTGTLELAVDLKPEIESIKEKGQIVLVVQHMWVSAIETAKRKLRQKAKVVD